MLQVVIMGPPEAPAKLLRDIPPQTVFMGSMTRGAERCLYVELDTAGFVLLLWSPRTGGNVSTHWQSADREVHNYSEHKRVDVIVHEPS